MTKNEISARIELLKKENDQTNEILAQTEQKRSELIREALVRNGRILELEEILKSVENVNHGQ